MEAGIEPKRFYRIRRPNLSGKHNGARISWEDNYEKLSDWSKNRIRYHMSGSTLIDVGDPDKNIAYSLYREALQRGGYGGLIDRYNLDYLATDDKLLKELSDYMKKKGGDVEVNWRYLVDLHRLHDYLPYADEEDFVDDIVDWVQRKPLHTWNGDEELWYSKFEESVRRVLFKSGKMPVRVMSVDDFFNNGDVWCTSGSGFEPESEKLSVLDKVLNKQYDVKKNKWSVRWKLSNYKLKRLLFKRRKQMCKAVQKSEPAKVRAVISSDLALYLKMTYVSQYLDQILSGRDDSTLFMSSEQRFQLWQKMAYDGTWRMPLDQSEFDKNVTLRQIMIILSNLRQLLSSFDVPDVVLEIMDLIIYALDGGVVIVGGRKIDITNGVLSGWRWTAFIDTIVNLAEVDLAKRWVEENSLIQVRIKELNAQGDDDWFKFDTKKEALAMWLAYESFGLYVNPGKFFLDTRRDEYLRRVMDRGIITGYPARSVTGICFRNPVSEKETIGADRIRQSLKKWKLFAERLDMPFSGSWWYRQWVRDSVQGTKGATKKLVEGWFLQPAALGGIGYDGGSDGNYPVPSSTILEHNPVEIIGEGYDEWVAFANKYGVDARACNRFACNTIDLQNNSLAKWVKYIYTDLKLDVAVPFGLESNVPGTIAVGANVRAYAYQKKIKWFKSLDLARRSTHYSIFEWEHNNKYVREINWHILPKKKKFSLDLVDGVSLTLAQLSNDYELVWNNYDPQLFQHKPKSWTNDLLSGRLKGFISPRPGWGDDVIGHINKQLVNGAVDRFLSINRPSLELWDSILASIDAAVPDYLATLSIRVVE